MKDVILIPGDPIAMQRIRKSKCGKHMYNPQSKEKKGLRWLVASQWSESPLEGPVFVQASFHIPMPRSWSKKKRDAMLNKPHTSTPDSDNFLKWINDVMSGIVFVDDRQVSDTAMRKRWGLVGTTYIKVQPVTDLFYASFLST